MASVPAIDKFFKLEEALKEYGFKIDEKGRVDLKLVKKIED